MVRIDRKTLTEWARRVMSEPRDELDRWQAAARYAYDLGRYGWRALKRDNAPQMASALAFRTLFALLPVVVVSTVVVKAVQGVDQFQRLVSRVIDALGMHEIRIIPPKTTVEPGDPQVVGLGAWLEELVGQAAVINLSALGWVGLAVVIYSAIWLMVSIENSFNAVYGAPEGRAWVRRVPMYWLVLTMSPVFIGLTLYLDNQFSQMIDGVGSLRWLLGAAKMIWGFSVAWLFMFSVYKLVPNTNVTTRAALIGSFVAAVFLQVGKSSLGAYLENAVSIRSLYGSLGLIPLFMFWVYLMWLVVLFGLEVSATIQMLPGRELKELEERQPTTGLVDPASVLPVMEVITERFGTSKATTPRDISDETRIPETIVSRIVDQLIRAGFLHQLNRADGAVSLARPPEQIPADQLIEIGFSLVDEGGGRPSALIQRLRDVQRQLASRSTLASVLASGGRAGPSDQAASDSVPIQP